MTQSQLTQKLSSIIGMESLDKKQLDRLALITTEKEIKKGEIICWEGEPPKYFHAVVSGRVKLSKQSANGLELTVNIVGEGGFFNAVRIDEGMPYYWTAETVDDSCILFIPIKKFTDFVHDNPEYAIRLVAILGDMIRVAYERLLDAFSENVEQRIINSLCMLYSKFGHTIKITNNQLSTVAGTTTSTTIRIISDLRDQKVLNTQRGIITIIDHERLEVLSGRSMSSLDDQSRKC